VRPEILNTPGQGSWKKNSLIGELEAAEIFCIHAATAGRFTVSPRILPTPGYSAERSRVCDATRLLSYSVTSKADEAKQFTGDCCFNLPAQGIGIG